MRAVVVYEDLACVEICLTEVTRAGFKSYRSRSLENDLLTELLLYSSSASQYNFLKAYNGQTVTVEVAPCNWNSKGNYRGCVLAVRNADGTKICNELNFTK